MIKESTLALENLEDKLEENVVQRLRRRSSEVRKLGFRLRSEYLDAQQATWCMIGTQKTIFIDSSQTAAEQLRQLEEAVAEYRRTIVPDSPSGHCES